MIDDVPLTPGVPSCAGLVDGLLYTLLPLDIIWALQDIYEEACADMPGHMAVEWPDSWVICGELHDQVSVGGQESRVSPDGIVTVDNSSVPLPCTIRKNLVVMAVQMHWMRESKIVEIRVRRVNFPVFPDYTHDAAISSIINVPLWVRRVVENTLLSQIKDWFIVVDTEGLVIDQVYWVAGLIFDIENLDIDGLVCRSGRNASHGTGEI